MEVSYIGNFCMVGWLNIIFVIVYHHVVLNIKGHTYSQCHLILPNLCSWQFIIVSDLSVYAFTCEIRFNWLY